jgi:hypothetical protein
MRGGNRLTRLVLPVNHRGASARNNRAHRGHGRFFSFPSHDKALTSADNEINWFAEFRNEWTMDREVLRQQ